MDFILAIAIFLAFVVKGITGFANTLVFGSIMSFSTSTVNITPIDLLTSIPSNALIAFKERKNINPKVFIPLSLLVVLGTIPGAILLKNGNVALLKIAFGFAVILIGLETLIRESKARKIKPNKIVLALIGVASGVLSGLFGVGAFLVAYIGRTTDNQAQFRGNICAVFLVENTFRLILYSINGIINKDILLTGIKVMPVMLVGLGVGIFLSSKISDKLVKKIVILMLMLTGLSLAISNILSLL